MNTTWKKLFIVPLLLAVAVAPLCAQDEAPVNNGTNAAVAAAPPTMPTQPAPQMSSAPLASPESYIRDEKQNRDDDMVAIMGIFGVFGGGTFVVGLFLYYRHRRNIMLHETLRAMIDKGVPIPPELLAAPLENVPPRIPSGVRNDLLIGLVLIAIGFGLSVFVPGPARKFGFIPLFVGLAFLISWKVEQKKKDQPGK